MVTKRKKHWSSKIRDMQACGQAVRWCRRQPSYAVAWGKCTRPDWLLWLYGRLATTRAQRKGMVLAACAAARTLLHEVPDGEDRPRLAVEAAEDWCKGKCSTERVILSAANAAANAAYAASNATSYAAYAASNAAYAAAYAASNAAYAAAYAAYAAPYAAARAASNATYAAPNAASFIRKHIKRLPLKGV